MPSRRTVVRGSAWAVPVVATAVAAPAFAVSAPCVTFDQVTTTCRTATGYIVTLQITACAARTVQIVAWAVGGLPASVTPGSISPTAGTTTQAFTVTSGAPLPLSIGIDYLILDPDSYHQVTLDNPVFPGVC